ncbi:Uncharacterised protein [Burkholderia pseudomallei]|nr:Uncharacterised protein [Burkholderia pseudomallei]CAJ3426184.1 Uncharacterised protein [Burkholderia pseudomallei]CAJ3428038.1 Uncharacterised protein [Burkholderia pseudomallei]CAJ3955721.1 Uncharacterised protein [Burkholderia pseudomallei]CAJ4029221.1 Uncharacterised protein [Burkholderia pseudomallei]
MGLGRDRECAGRHGENGGARRRNRRTRAPTQTGLRTLERRRASAACPKNRRSDRLGSPSPAWSGSEIGRRRRCIATARSVEWRRQASVASAEKAAFGSHTVARVGSARGAVRRFRSSNHRHGARSRAKQRAARPPVDPGNPSNPSNPSLDIRRTPLFAPLPMSIDALASRSDGLQRKPDTSIDAARTVRRRVRTDHPLRAVHRVPRSNRSVSAAHCRRNGVRMAAEPIKIDPSAYGPGAARDRPCDTLVAERGARTFAAPRRHRRAAAPMPARPPPASVFQRARRPHIIRASRIRRATGARRLRRMDRRARPRGAAHRNPR